MTTTDLLNEIIDVREGGMVFTHDDPDPPTFAGITIDTARRFYGKAFTVEQLKKLSRADVLALYLRMFVIDPNFHLVHSPELHEVLVDFGINSGPPTAVRELQRVLVRASILEDADVDGVLGPKTLAAIERHHSVIELADDLAVARALYCARLVQNDVNAFLARFATLKREQPAIVARYFPTRKDELDFAAYGYGWIRRALAPI